MARLIVVGFLGRGVALPHIFKQRLRLQNYPAFSEFYGLLDRVSFTDIANVNHMMSPFVKDQFVNLRKIKMPLFMIEYSCGSVAWFNP